MKIIVFRIYVLEFPTITVWSVIVKNVLYLNVNIFNLSTLFECDYEVWNIGGLKGNNYR
jgi:hypothetical protein